MKIRVTKECPVKLSAISTRTYPAGWTGDIPDELAVQMIMLGVAEDPSGEVTPEAIEAEIARQQAEAEAPPAESAPAPAKPKRSRKKAADGDPAAEA